jgi:hypothetical protein
MERLGICDFYVSAGWRLFLEVGKSLTEAEELVLLGVGLGATLLGQGVDGRCDSARQVSAIQNKKSVHSAFRYNSFSLLEGALCSSSGRKGIFSFYLKTQTKPAIGITTSLSRHWAQPIRYSM